MNPFDEIWISEAIAWIVHGPTTEDFRSPALEPPTGLAGETPEAVAHAVDHVATTRANVIWNKSLTLPAPPFPGELLLYLPHVPADAAGPPPFCSMLDESGEPGWDTWVAYVASEDSTLGFGYVVCWVPPMLLGELKRQLEDSPHPRLRWYDPGSGDVAASVNPGTNQGYPE